MSTTQRVVRKQLAGAEDLLQGVGVVTQTRGTGTYPIHKLDVPIPMTDIAEMQASAAEFVRLYTSDVAYIDYRRIADATEGIASSVEGYWVVVSTSNGLYGSTLERPTLNLSIGQFFFDSTLAKPIWYTGSTWVDATGTEV